MNSNSTNTPNGSTADSDNTGKDCVIVVSGGMDSVTLMWEMRRRISHIRVTESMPPLTTITQSLPVLSESAVLPFGVFVLLLFIDLDVVS